METIHATKVSKDSKYSPLNVVGFLQNLLKVSNSLAIKDLNSKCIEKFGVNFEELIYCCEGSNIRLADWLKIYSKEFKLALENSVLKICLRNSVDESKPSFQTQSKNEAQNESPFFLLVKEFFKTCETNSPVLISHICKFIKSKTGLNPLSIF